MQNFLSYVVKKWNYRYSLLRECSDGKINLLFPYHVSSFYLAPYIQIND